MWSLKCVSSVVVLHRLSCPSACEILVPQTGIEPTSPALQGRLLTTGPPGKSWEQISYTRYFDQLLGYSLLISNFLRQWLSMFWPWPIIRMGFPGGSEVKASAWNVGDPGSIPGSGRSPGEGKWQPTPVILPGESHGGRSLVSYSPPGRKESDTTKRFHFHFHNMIQIWFR